MHKSINFDKEFSNFNNKLRSLHLLYRKVVNKFLVHLLKVMEKQMNRFHSSTNHALVVSLNHRTKAKKEAVDKEIITPRWASRGLKGVDPNDFLNCLHAIKRNLNYLKVLGEKKVKLIVVKLRKYASLYWENLTQTRAHDRRSCIKT